MPGGLAIAALGGIAALIFAGSSSSGSSTTTSPVTPSGGLSCSDALAKLPDTPGAGGTPGLRTIIAGGLMSTVMTAAQFEMMATTMDGLAVEPSASSDVRAAAVVLARCLRDRAKAAGGGPGPVDVSKLTCDQAFAMLPAPVQSEVLAAVKNGSSSALNLEANALDALASTTSDLQAKQLLQMSAKCLRGAAVTPVPGPPAPGTIIFDPALVSARGGNGVTAHNLAVAIGDSPAVGVGPADTADDGTYASLYAFSKYGPNAAGLAALQRASGITPDGRYGAQTQRAFDYFTVNSS